MGPREELLDPGQDRVGLGDQPGPVGAVSTFLADTGANIVSLDQHSTQHWRLDRTDGNIHLAVAPVPHVLRTKLGHILTGLGDEAREHTGGTFMQRTIIHLPGLAAARDASKRDFAKPIGSPSWRRPRDYCLLDLLWRNRCGELDMSVAMVITNRPDLSDEVRPFGVPFIYARHARRFRTEPNGASSTCYAETSIWWRWPAAR